VANTAVQPEASKADPDRVSGLVVFMAIVVTGVMAFLGWLIHRSWSDYETGHADASLAAVICMSLLLASMAAVTAVVILKVIKSGKS
jgi:hypothetical protein